MSNIVDSKTSDGYHTFEELYEQRAVLFALIVNVFNGWKSLKHSDGSSYEGFFIAGLEYQEGKQITFHIESKYWNLYKCVELQTAPKWDGHTVKEVIERIIKKLDNMEK